jgi:large subunit ribosomal protein L18
MQKINLKTERHKRRVKRIRAKIIGSAVRPRLSTHRSDIHIYAQLIDDAKGVTIVSFSDLKIKKEKGLKKTQIAELVGEGLAKLAIAKKIKSVVFDRGGFTYHGRVKALADGARKGGLKF